MKKTYYIRSEEGQAFALGDARLEDPEAAPPAIDAQHEIELSYDEAKAMIAAGWIEEVPEKPSKGGKS